MIDKLRFHAAVLLAATAAAPAFAHTGHHASFGLGIGFLHPLTGIDHVLAMVAVGIWAAWLGGRAMLLVPAAFVAAMIAGGTVGYAGAAWSLTEVAIALSVVALGLFVAFRLRLPLAASIAAVALFGLAHGHAHGAEITAGASAVHYFLGFALATVLLHAAGLVLGRSGASGVLVRTAGATTAAGGVVLLLV